MTKISNDSKVCIEKEIEKVKLQKQAVKERLDAIEIEMIPWKKQLGSLNSKIEQLKNDIK
jgi:archaellum component FlaC